MKIAIFNETVFKGSVGKIAYGQFKRLREDGHEVRLYYGRNDHSDEEGVIRTVSTKEEYIHAALARLTGLSGYYSKSATRKIIKELSEWKPDLVQLYNLHGYYLRINLLLQYLGQSRVPVVYSMLDEFPFLGRCCFSFDCDGYNRGCKNCHFSHKEYPKTWFFRFSNKFFDDKQVAYKYLSNICFVGPEYVVRKAKHSRLLHGRRFCVVDEWIDTDNTFFPRMIYKYIDNRLIKTKKKVVVTVTNYVDPRKGGDYFIQLAQRFVRNKEYIFVFVGISKKIKLPCNCISKEYVSNQDELAEYYSVGDIFICTSLADTMPNVCLDSMACGTPVLGFKNSGIPYVADEPIGKFVKTGDVEALAEIIKNTKKKSPETIVMCRNYALSRYSQDLYYKKMIDLYDVMTMANDNEKRIRKD